MELSLVHLYAGQRSYREELEEVTSHGLHLSCVTPVNLDGVLRIVEVDALFCR